MFSLRVSIAFSAPSPLFLPHIGEVEVCHLHFIFTLFAFQPPSEALFILLFFGYLFCLLSCDLKHPRKYY